MDPLTATERAAVERWFPLACSIVRSRFPLWEWDDLVQEAVFGVVRAVRTWRPGSGRSEASWVYTCVLSATRDAVRGREHRSRLAFVPLEDDPAVPDETDLVDLADMLQRFVATCSSRERRFLAARAAGCTLAEAGAELGVGESAASYIGTALRERFKAAA